MLVYRVQCEMCEAHFPFSPLARPEPPKGWITLFEGNPAHSNGWHFCSKEHLHQWLQSPEERQARPEAEDKKQDTKKCMLFIELVQDFLRENDRTNGYIHARSRTLQELFALRFPDAPKFTETIEGCIDTQINIWRYDLLGATDDHIEWAYVAKKCGLIDDYKVEEVQV